MKFAYLVIVLGLMLSGENRALKCGTGLWPYEVVDGIEVIWQNSTVNFFDDELLGVAMMSQEVLNTEGGKNPRIRSISAYAIKDELLYLKFRDYDQKLYFGKAEQTIHAGDRYSVQTVNLDDALPYLRAEDWFNTSHQSCLYGPHWYWLRLVGWFVVILLGFRILKGWHSAKNVAS